MMTTTTITGNGSKQLTGKDLKDIAAELPDDAVIISFTAANSQRDGWWWSMTAKISGE